MDTFAVALIAFSIILISLLSRDWRKYNQNTPYTPTKIKRNILARIALGIKAGFHYLHFIETYDHKKYNTQVFTPKTLECYIGVLFAVIFWITYLSIAWYLKFLFGNLGLLVLLIPLVTNLISIIFYRHK